MGYNHGSVLGPQVHVHLNQQTAATPSTPSISAPTYVQSTYGQSTYGSPNGYPSGGYSTSVAPAVVETKVEGNKVTTTSTVVTTMVAYQPKVQFVPSSCEDQAWKTKGDATHGYYCGVTGCKKQAEVHPANSLNPGTTELGCCKEHTATAKSMGIVNLEPVIKG
jgi:hypothetical protein